MKYFKINCSKLYDRVGLKSPSGSTNGITNLQILLLKLASVKCLLKLLNIFELNATFSLSAEIILSQDCIPF